MTRVWKQGAPGDQGGDSADEPDTAGDIAGEAGPAAGSETPVPFDPTVAYWENAQACLPGTRRISEIIAEIGSEKHRAAVLAVRDAFERMQQVATPNDQAMADKLWR